MLAIIFDLIPYYKLESKSYRNNQAKDNGILT